MDDTTIKYTPEQLAWALENPMGYQDGAPASGVILAAEVRKAREFEKDVRDLRALMESERIVLESDVPAMLEYAGIGKKLAAYLDREAVCKS